MSGATLNLTRTAGSVAILMSLFTAVTAAPASAVEPAPDQHHISWDPTGAVFRCDGSDLTVQPGGVVTESFHLWTDSLGMLRFQDAITLRDVTATDSTGRPFPITGTMTIADKLVSWEQPLVATDTTHFVVRSVTGGVYGKVQVVAHFTANGGQHYLDLSDCEAP